MDYSKKFKQGGGTAARPVMDPDKYRALMTGCGATVAEIEAHGRFRAAGGLKDWDNDGDNATQCSEDDFAPKGARENGEGTSTPRLKNNPRTR